MGQNTAPGQLKHFVEIGDGFFHLRGKFYLGYLFDIGTQMALCRRSTGRFLVLDTINLSASEKSELDTITNNGKLIDAVIGTHPFHTSYFTEFYAMYPNAKYYGTPRHCRLFPNINWVKDGLNPANPIALTAFEPDIQMRIPSGAEFVDPKPELTNHFANVFVFHPKSNTVYNDDTIVNWQSSAWSVVHYINMIQGLHFHPTMTSVGLQHNPDAPLAFKKWMQHLLNDWQFDNLCTAHNDNVIGDAHRKVSDLLLSVDQVLDDLSKKYSDRQ